MLTAGRPRVVSIEGFGRSDAEVLALAASLERHSTHPLAGAVVAAAQAGGAVVPEASGITAHQGLGLSGTLGAGRAIWVGNEAFAERREAVLPPSVRERLLAASAEGRTVIIVGEESAVVGLLGLEDDLREGAAEMVEELRACGLGPLIMVTGDHPVVAARVSERLGLDEARAGLLPDQKRLVIRDLAERSGPVGMVGDGVNDGPALAEAHAGITLGMASDVALDVADVVLVTNDLTRLPYAVVLARKTRRVVVQNLVLASAVILVAVPLAFLGRLPLPLGVVLHEGSTLLVVGNGLRLLRTLPRRGKRG